MSNFPFPNVNIQSGIPTELMHCVVHCVDGPAKSNVGKKNAWKAKETNHDWKENGIHG